MKNSIIAFLVIVVLVFGGYAFWEHKKIESVQSPVAQNNVTPASTESSIVPAAETQNGRVVYGDFSQDQGGQVVGNKIIAANIDGSDQIISTTPVYALSVDAYNIAGYGRDGSLWIGDAQGNFKQVLNSIKVDSSAIVSPDHSTVAYVAVSKNDATDYQLLAADLNTQIPELLFDHLEQFSVAGFSHVIPFAFSPDGQTIYLHYEGDSHQSYDGLSTSILAFSMKTKQITKIHISDNDIQEFAVSPDHTKIAFSDSGSDTEFSIYDIASGSTEQFPGQILFGGIGSSPQPWSPDSTKFAFASQSPASLGYVDVADNSTHTVNTPTGALDFGSLYWLDNSTLLSLYENYDTKNPSFWDHGSTVFDIKTGEHTDFVEPPYSESLLGVIPAF